VNDWAACCGTTTAKRPEVVCHLTPGAVLHHRRRCPQVTIHFPITDRRAVYPTHLKHGPGIALSRLRPKLPPIPVSNPSSAAQLQEVRVSSPHGKHPRSTAHNHRVFNPDEILEGTGAATHTSLVLRQRPRALRACSNVPVPGLAQTRQAILQE
jgi:hypothetical protein